MITVRNAETSLTTIKLCSNTSHQPCIRGCSFGGLRDLVTVLALSFHSIFEGLAVGLETSVENVWKLFAGNILVIKNKHIFLYYNINDND